MSLAGEITGIAISSKYRPGWRILISFIIAMMIGMDCHENDCCRYQNQPANDKQDA